MQNIGCLSKWFKGLYDKGLTQREAQEQMTFDIKSMIDNHQIGIFEGGTGIGKSYAALMGAFSSRYDSDGKRKDDEWGSPIVYATGTIALQNQIVSKDIPALCKILGLDDLVFMLVKGRRRYACPKKLWEVSSYQKGLFDDDGDDHDQNQGLIEMASDMRSSLRMNSWDGDLDFYKKKVPSDVVDEITVDGNACVGRRCSEFAKCPFYEARKKMGSADMLVVNHDLLLSDLSMGGGKVIPCAPEDTDYLIDEAHRIPECAVKHFGGDFYLQGSIKLVESVQNKLGRMTRGMKSVPESLGETMGELSIITIEMDSALSLLDQAINSNNQLFSDKTWLFADGVIPQQLSTPMDSLKIISDDFLKRLGKLQTIFDDNDNVRLKFGDKVSDQHASEFGFFFGRMQRLCRTMELMLDEASLGGGDDCEIYTTRWIEVAGKDIKINAFPTFAGRSLSTIVWSKVRSAVMFSATLQSLGSFNKFKHDIGLFKSESMYYPSPFDYSKARLFLASDGYNPNSDEHIEVVARAVIAAHKKAVDGILVVFTSIKSMRATEEVIRNLAESVLGDILIQGDYSRPEVVRRHTKAINNGDKSIIFGLSSFGEGVDLPGSLCGHVIIPKLPFSVPSSPMEQSRVKWMESRGKNSFMGYSLPGVSIKLTQMVGRLIRTETDTGSVVILDNRLCTKRYGKLLVNNLPPFLVSRFSVRAYAPSTNNGLK